MALLMSDAAIGRAEAIWNAYERTHDLSGRKGQAAGINPETGAVFFGESAAAIARERRELGDQTPLYFVRVGESAYLQKGGRR